MQEKNKETTPTLFSRRFWVREIYAAAEGNGAALIYSALTFALGWLFAATHALGGAYPFALAYLAAADRRLPFALLGAAIGAATLGTRGLFYIGAYLILILLRIFLSRPRPEGRILPASREYFEEEPPLRAAAACIAGTALSLYELFAGGLTTASIAFAVLMILLPTAFAALFVGFFADGRSLYEMLTATANTPAREKAPAREGREKDAPAKGQADLPLAAAVTALLFVILLGLRPFSVFGISLSMAAAAVLLFFLPGKWGLVRGGIPALIASAGTLALPYLPAYAVMALLSSMTGRLGAFSMLVAAALGGTATAYFLTGTDALLSFLPEVFLALALSWPLSKQLPRLATLEEERARRESAERREVPDGTGRMEILSEAYLSLSEMFGNLAGLAARPNESEYREACRVVFQRHCEGCAGEAGCWERGDRVAARTLDCFAEQYARGIPPVEIRLGERDLRSCGARDKILTEIREACAALEEDKRARERNGIFARNYRMTGEILLDAARRNRGESSEDFALGRAARAVLLEEGVSARRVSVYGTRRLRLVASGVHWDPERVSAERLSARLGEVCGVRLGEPTVEEKNGEIHIVMEGTRRFSVRAARASRACGEEVSGDSFTTFEGEGDFYYALLSDGMGSGKEAAITAGLCGTFLEKTLAAGTEKGTALKALNTLLCEREGECSATLDLLEIDLLHGNASFIKSGAAASYVRRGESLFRIRAGTVPMGILGAIDAERIRFDVEPGDVIVMISDGISQSEEDATWLCELLGGSWGTDGRGMAERIIEGAYRNTDRRDDMTVALLEITEAA